MVKKSEGTSEKTANVMLGAESEPLGPGPVTVGMAVICELPDADAQRAGFYCEEAERLVALFPGRFKLMQKKGGK